MMIMVLDVEHKICMSVGFRIASASRLTIRISADIRDPHAC